ncbi:MAG: thioesterase family protein [Actinomycetota bacterium]
MGSLEVSHRSTVTPDQIDEIGHMNVRYYGANAIAGTAALCERLGFGLPPIRSTYTRHHHEQMEGNELEVRSALLDGDRLRFYHELRNVADDDLAATFVYELDHAPVEAPTIALPEYGRPRSLRLDTDGLASAPSLDRVEALDLATRKPRTVGTEDTLGGQTVPPEMGGQLLWGGDRLDDEESWIRTLPNGDRFAYVVVENRMWIRPEPINIGTQIQSFRATVEIGEKIARDVAWCFDTSTGDALVVVEAVDLCFNMTERRSMVVPPGARAEDDADFHPELAPR